MNEISAWLNANTRSINAGKTKFIICRSESIKPKIVIKILINNEVTKQVKNTTFLGIVISIYKRSNLG